MQVDGLVIFSQHLLYKDRGESCNSIEDNFLGCRSCRATTKAKSITTAASKPKRNHQVPLLRTVSRTNIQVSAPVSLHGAACISHWRLKLALPRDAGDLVPWEGLPSSDAIAHRETVSFKQKSSRRCEALE